MGVALFDTSVMVGFLDADNSLHAAADAAVRAAAAEHVFAASVVTVAELLTGAKLGHRDEPAVRDFFNEMGVRRIPLDEPTAEQAAELRARHQALTMPDALILATADLYADVVLTADKRWRRVSGLSCEVRYVV